jgi:hypothetical protein
MQDIEDGLAGSQPCGLEEGAGGMWDADLPVVRLKKRKWKGKINKTMEKHTNLYEDSVLQFVL